MKNGSTYGKISLRLLEKSRYNHDMHPNYDLDDFGLTAFGVRHIITSVDPAVEKRQGD